MSIRDPDLLHLRIRRVGTCPQQVKQVVREPHGNLIVIQYKDGRLAVAREVSGLKDRSFYLNSGNWSWQSGYIEALHRLGVITDEQLEGLRRRDEEANRKSEVERALLDAERALPALGVEFTAGQKRKIEKLIKKTGARFFKGPRR